MADAAGRASKAPDYWNVERAGFALTVLTLLIGGAVSFTKFDGRIDDIEGDLKRLTQSSAEGRCTQILMRQIKAIESASTKVEAKIDAMARRQGCVRQYGLELSAAARPMTEQELADAERRAAQEREAFERDMAEVDEQLGLHDDPLSLRFLQP